MIDLFLYKSALRDLLRFKRVAMVLIPTLLPALLAMLWRYNAGGDFDPYDMVNTISSTLVYGFLLVILSVVFGTGVISQEVEQKTIVYLLTRPVPRWRIILMKWLASVTMISAASIISMLLLHTVSFWGAPKDSSAILRFEDVRNKQAFVELFRKHEDPLSNYFFQRFPERLQERLVPELFNKRMEALNPPPRPGERGGNNQNRRVRVFRNNGPVSDDRLEQRVLTEINKVLRSEKELFTAERFANVTLTPAVTALLKTLPQGRELTRANRMLFELAYPALVQERKEPDYDLWRDLAVIPVGAMTYGAFCLFLATILNRPMMYGLVFAFGWEFFVPNMPGKFQLVSIMTYLRVLAPHPRPPAESVDLVQFLAGSNADPISLRVAMLVIACIIAVALGAALYIFSNNEYVPREDAE